MRKINLLSRFRNTQFLMSKMAKTFDIAQLLTESKHEILFTLLDGVVSWRQNMPVFAFPHLFVWQTSADKSIKQGKQKFMFRFCCTNLYADLGGYDSFFNICYSLQMRLRLKYNWLFLQQLAVTLVFELIVIKILQLYWWLYMQLI